MENKDLLSDIAKMDKATSKVKAFINSLVDENSFVETDVFMSGKNFDNSVEALGEAVVTGYATINGRSVQIFAQNPDVLKGSLSAAQADKIAKCMNRAVSSDTPLISIIDSCGARVGDGTSIMEGYAKLIRMSTILEDQVPHICIVNGACVGMMTTFVASADFTFMSKVAVMSVNSPMYLLSDSKTLPVDYKKSLGFNSYKSTSDLAQFTYDSNKDLKAQLDKLFNILSNEEEDTDSDPNDVNPNIEKASAIDAVNMIFDENSKLEYCADYAKDVSCSFEKINGINVGVIATSGDYLSLDGLQKATSFINKLEVFGLPLITLVDTKGIDSKLEDEVSGSAAYLSYALMGTIASTSIPKIGVAFGNAIGYGYAALMSKEIGFNYTLAVTKSKISPISEEVSIAMMSDQLKAENRQENIAKLSTEYAEMLQNPLKAAKEGYVDNVIEATNLRPYIASALLMLLGI